MSAVDLIGIGVVAIFVIIGIVKQAFDFDSKYIPLISLVLGIGLAVYIGITKDINVIELILSALIPALSASGVHSTINTLKGNGNENV